MTPADRPADGAASPHEERHAFDPKHAPDICAECGQGPLWWGHGSDPKPFSLEWAIQYFDAAEKQGLRTPAHRCGFVVLSSLRAVERERDQAYEQAAKWCEERAEAMRRKAKGYLPDGIFQRDLLNHADWVEGCAETIRDNARALSPGAATTESEGPNA